MEEHVRTQALAIVALQFLAGFVLHHILQLIVNALGEALLRQYLVEYCLSVVTLHLRVVLECSGQFDGTLSSRLGLLNDSLDACLHRAAELVLLLRIAVHRLFHLCYGLVERIDNRLHVLLVDVGKLCLTHLQHILSSSLEVSFQVLNRFRKSLLHALHRLIMPLLLGCKHSLMLSFLCLQEFLVRVIQY